MKYAYKNGKILNGTKDMQVQTGLIILTEGEKIAAIVPEETRLSGYTEIDLQGKYIMPGLINMHVHLAGNGKPQKKQRDNAKLVKTLMSNRISRAIAYRMVAGFAKDELLSGVTTIRTVGGLGTFDTRLRDEIKAGKKTGPRILAANEGISVAGGHMAGSVAIAAESIDAAVAHVDEAKCENVNLIKLMITGGVLDAKEKGVPGELKMAPEMVKAVCNRAHALGYQVAAHVESPQGVRVALENGVDSIEHGAKPDAHIAALFKENGAFQVATLCPALPYGLFDCQVSHATKEQKANGKVVFDGVIEMAKENLAQGVPVGLGTDTACPFVTQYDMWRELDFYGKYCGVSNAFALYTGTLLNATLAGVGDVTGSIEVGKCADMIVTKGNPLEDLSVLRHVEMVVKDGVIYDHPQVKKIPEVEVEMDKFNRVK